MVEKNDILLIRTYLSDEQLRYINNSLEERYEIIYMPNNDITLSLNLLNKVKILIVVELNVQEVSHYSNLRFVHIYGRGTDKICLNYLNDKKIIYKRCKTHELVISISEYVLLQILCWERNLEDYNRISHDGNWDWSRRNNYHFRSLKQIKVGIVGNGFIGSGVSNYLKNLGLHIYHINVGNRIRSVDYNMLGAVDYLTLHLPLSTETEQCIGSSLFSAMKKNAVLINTSRGKIINETELCTAIKNGDIRGASLDVVSEEPLLNSSIIKNNNRIVLSPHIAGRSESALMALVYEIVENISIWVNV